MATLDFLISEKNQLVKKFSKTINMVVCYFSYEKDIYQLASRLLPAKRISKPYCRVIRS